MTFKRYLLILFFISITLAACTSTHKPKIKREVYLMATTFAMLNDWEQDQHLQALHAFQKSCKVILQIKPSNNISTLTKIGGKAIEWHKICKDVLSKDITTHYAAKLFFERWFTPYIVHDQHHNATGKITGYYEIELYGSKKRSAKYKYPVYRAPPNLKKNKGSMHISRAAINRGALNGRKLEIAWVDSRARLFFMHIQGSGVIKLGAGKEIRVGYADQNGLPYSSIGPVFKYYCKHNIHSATDMMRWIDQHPKEGLKIMDKNQSYVFFREVHGESPVGGQGVSLTTERSIAIDAGLYPYGAPIWLETSLPKTPRYSTRKRYRRLFIAQDTGGAIKGAIRADVFFGRGARAEELAGYMNALGKYYLLLPKSIMVPVIYKAG